MEVTFNVDQQWDRIWLTSLTPSLARTASAGIFCSRPPRPPDITAPAACFDRAENWNDIFLPSLVRSPSLMGWLTMSWFDVCISMLSIAIPVTPEGEAEDSISGDWSSFSVRSSSIIVAPSSASPSFLKPFAIRRCRFCFFLLTQRLVWPDIPLSSSSDELDVSVSPIPTLSLKRCVSPRLTAFLTLCA